QARQHHGGVRAAGLRPLARRGALACCVVLATLARPAPAQDVEAGRAKAQACAACHGADGNAASAELPNLAGQTWRYLYPKLKDFQEGRRSNPVMAPLVAGLSRQDMVDIASYFAAQRLKPANFAVDEDKARRGKAKAEETLCTMCHQGGFLGQNEIPRLAGQN